MMNIETLLQAAKILESQQPVPSKKRRNDAEYSTVSNSIPTSILSPTTINTNPIIIAPTTSLIKNEQYPSIELNLNVQHLNYLTQQQQSLHSAQHFKSDQNEDVNLNDQNSERNSEVSNRAQTTCIRDREIHNRLEKHRRAHLKDCFDGLKAEVPCRRDRKITNLQILNLAIKYIQSLTRKEREYENEIALLTSRHNELQQRLGTLKAELNSNGHDVETWLDSCSDIDHSVSTRTASEAELYRTFDDDVGDDCVTRRTLSNGHDTLDSNNNSHDIKSTANKTHTNDSKVLITQRKTFSNRQRPRPSKRKSSPIPTTNLLQTLTMSTRAEDRLNYNTPRHLRLDQSCNLLTSLKDKFSSTTLTPITDIRYEIVDIFTKGATPHFQTQQQQPQQISPLPSIASLMNRHSSPIVSPTKQTIGINAEPLTTSTTNILHQPVATS